MWTRLSDWLKDLPSTNFKIVAAVGLAYITAVFYFVLEACKRTPDSVNFISWLAFVAGCWGFAYRQFSKKRDTYASPSPDSERAGVPETPAPKEPS